MGSLVKRCDKLAFYGVQGSEGTTVFTKMAGFTEISVSKNPKEYKRQYVDEEFEKSDVVGYSPSISYTFDRFSENSVHDDIVNITDSELLGAEAVRTIIIVDMKAPKAVEGEYAAVCRDFSVIPDSEGKSTDAYVYSGSFKANGAKIHGSAKTTDDWQTITFTEEIN